MARLSTRRVYLDYITPDDLPLIYDLFVGPDTGPFFRFGGRVPPPQHIQEHLWDGVLAQWMVVGIADDKRRGLVCIASPDFQNGYAYLSALATPETRRTGLLLEAVGLVLDYAFDTWPFRKLYAEVSDLSLGQFASAEDRFFVDEGRRKAHVFQRGEFRDLITLAIYREHWKRARLRFERALESGRNGDVHSDVTGKCSEDQAIPPRGNRLPPAENSE